MNQETINLLLIDGVESNYYRINLLLKQINHTQFDLDWVSDLEQGSIAKTVILITGNPENGRKALNEGITDYLIEDQLTSVLLEHSLR